MTPREDTAFARPLTGPTVLTPGMSHEDKSPG